MRIRFRLLDPAMPSLPGCQGLPDLTLDGTELCRAGAARRTPVITENETNFLAFPQVAHAIVVFGAGYGWYDDLRFDRFQPTLRMEQERVGFSWWSAQLRSRLR